MTSTTSTLDHIAGDHVYRMLLKCTRLLTIILTTKTNSTTVERGNTALCYTKTYLRSSNSHDSFNAFTLKYFHRHITLNYKDIIDTYVRKYANKLSCQSPLSEWLI